MNNVYNTANRTIGFLKRNLQIKQKHIKSNAYKTLVRPQVEYAAALWDPYTTTNKQKIEKIQRRAARYVCNNYSREASVTQMITELGWRSLEQRRADIRLILLYKVIHALVAVNFTSDLIPFIRATKHHHSMALRIPTETKLYIQQSYLPRTIVQWNSLPEAVVSTPTLQGFKSGVRKLIH